ncbi:pyridoxamine 5'-phosphate oxidase family protein [Accumulibacter sp.]|uniref:pyridoxamine 5'-phosphate oxidase family protein n=1 Tax=Accumulibacter sp. TaxID=2053492 RepID=UPI002C06A57F|nr:pyridoxamine 5'-phosphate oxidase family protein [Accumulibacter sp.]HPU79460.1 pyridoxamine 5'-phosphate oxidase family protein [Accumulibacter sp.]
MSGATDPLSMTRGEPALESLLQGLLAAQKYAVLATESGGQPYTSLMAFSVSEDLRDLILLTERATHKYANLMANRRVAVFIDNRENVGADTLDAVAITALGEAEEVAGDDCARLREAYLTRHPYLAGFATSPSCAVMRVRVRSYIVVRDFQEVQEWRMR